MYGIDVVSVDHVVKQDVGKTKNGRHGRANLVAHIGQEFTLCTGSGERTFP